MLYIILGIILFWLGFLVSTLFNISKSEDILKYERILDIWNERPYRKKYLEERRKENPKLLYPDADEIYQKYYKLKDRLANECKWCIIRSELSICQSKLKELERKNNNGRNS